MFCCLHISGKIKICLKKAPYYISNTQPQTFTFTFFFSKHYSDSRKYGICLQMFLAADLNMLVVLVSINCRRLVHIEAKYSKLQ